MITVFCLISIIVTLLWLAELREREWRSTILQKENQAISAITELSNITGKKYYFDSNNRVRVAEVKK